MIRQTYLHYFGYLFAPVAFLISHATRLTEFILAPYQPGVEATLALDHASRASESQPVPNDDFKAFLARALRHARFVGSSFQLTDGKCTV